MSSSLPNSKMWTLYDLYSKLPEKDVIDTLQSMLVPRPASSASALDDSTAMNMFQISCPEENITLDFTFYNHILENQELLSVLTSGGGQRSALETAEKYSRCIQCIDVDRLDQIIVHDRTKPLIRINFNKKEKCGNIAQIDIIDLKFKLYDCCPSTDISELTRDCAQNKVMGTYCADDTKLVCISKKSSNRSFLRTIMERENNGLSPLAWFSAILMCGILAALAFGLLVQI